MMLKLSLQIFQQWETIYEDDFSAPEPEPEPESDDSDFEFDGVRTKKISKTKKKREKEERDKKIAANKPTKEPSSRRRTHADNIPDSEKPFACDRKYQSSSSCTVCPIKKYLIQYIVFDRSRSFWTPCKINYQY